MSDAFPITVIRGTRWTITFTFYANLKTKAVKDITGYQARFLVFADQDSEDGPFSINVGSNGSPVPTGASVVVNGSAGQITVSIPRESTSFPPASYWYNLKILLPNGNPLLAAVEEDLAAFGLFIVKPGSSARV